MLDNKAVDNQRLMRRATILFIRMLLLGTWRLGVMTPVHAEVVENSSDAM